MNKTFTRLKETRNILNVSKKIHGKSRINPQAFELSSNSRPVARTNLDSAAPLKKARIRGKNAKTIRNILDQKKSKLLPLAKSLVKKKRTIPTVNDDVMKPKFVESNISKYIERLMG